MRLCKKMKCLGPRQPQRPGLEQTPLRGSSQAWGPGSRDPEGVGGTAASDRGCGPVRQPLPESEAADTVPRTEVSRQATAQPALPTGHSHFHPGCPWNSGCRPPLGPAHILQGQDVSSQPGLSACRGPHQTPEGSPSTQASVPPTRAQGNPELSLCIQAHQARPTHLPSPSPFRCPGDRGPWRDSSPHLPASLGWETCRQRGVDPTPPRPHDPMPRRSDGGAAGRRASGHKHHGAHPPQLGGVWAETPGSWWVPPPSCPSCLLALGPRKPTAAHRPGKQVQEAGGSLTPTRTPTAWHLEATSPQGPCLLPEAQDSRQSLPRSPGGLSSLYPQ